MNAIFTVRAPILEARIFFCYKSLACIMPRFVDHPKRQPVFDSSNHSQSKNSDIEKPQIFVYSIVFDFNDKAAAVWLSPELHKSL